MRDRQTDRQTDRPLDQQKGYTSQTHKTNGRQDTGYIDRQSEKADRQTDRQTQTDGEDQQKGWTHRQPDTGTQPDSPKNKVADRDGVHTASSAERLHRQ